MNQINNPNEAEALEILKDIKESLEKNQMTEYSAYSFIAHEIAKLLDAQMLRLNEMNKLMPRPIFTDWLEQKMRD